VLVFCHFINFPIPIQATTFLLIPLLVEIIQDVRKAVGENFVVGIRISQAKVNNFSYRPAKEQDAQIIFESLGHAGTDYIHITEYQARQPAFETGSDSLVALAKNIVNYRLSQMAS